MKKLNLQKIILACLIVFSLSCYIYLNSGKIDDQLSSQSLIELKEAGVKTEKEVMLPDVRVIKAIIQKGIDVLPAS